MGMDPTVCVYTCDAPAVNRSEILRYAGAREGTPEMEELLDLCLEEATAACTYRVCYRELPILKKGEILDLGFCTTTSQSLARALSDCTSVVLFAATVGLGIDRLIARYARISPARSLLFQAIGTERVEALCDAFAEELNRRMTAQGLFTRPRFSPGYGDLPLALQADVFASLDCGRQIGLTLSESLLMSPSKSVTAIVGISAEPKRRHP